MRAVLDLAGLVFFVAVVLAGYALFLRHTASQTVLMSTYLAAIVPVVVLGLNWKRATPLAAVVAIVSSLVINFSVEIFVDTVSSPVVVFRKGHWSRPADERKSRTSIVHAGGAGSRCGFSSS